MKYISLIALGADRQWDTGLLDFSLLPLVESPKIPPITNP